MDNKRDLKLIMLMILCTGYFFSFSIFGEKAYERVSASKKDFQENTVIGPVDISLLSKEEALEKLKQEQRSWLEEATVRLQYMEKKHEFDKSSFIFSLEESIEGAISGSRNELHVDVAGEMVTAALLDFAIEAEEFNREAFIRELLSYPQTLQSGVHTIKLEDFLQLPREQTVISEASVSFGDHSEQIDLWISQFPKVTISGHSQFSILDAVEEKGIRTFTSEGLSIIATAIYQTVMPTNFTATERSISRELPNYVKAGYEAKVDSKKNMDLVIANPNDHPYTWEFKQAENALHVTLSGPELLNEYRIELAKLETFPPKNIIQYDAKLAYGQTKIKAQGKEGYLQKVYRETVDSTGVSTDRELLSEDFYPPIHTVVLHSIQPKPVIPQTGIKPSPQGTPGTNNNINTEQEEQDESVPEEEEKEEEKSPSKNTDDESYYMEHTK